MTYIQLCQMVHLLLRVGDDTPGTQPTELTGNTGPVAEIVQWVAAAYSDLQRLSSQWFFLKQQGVMTVPEGVSTLSAASIQAQPGWEQYEMLAPFVCDEYGYVLTSAVEDVTRAEQEVRMLPFERFYGVQDQRPLSTGQPQFFAITPSGDLVFDTITDREYLIRSFFRRTPHVFEDKDASPVWPNKYDMTLVYWVVVNYYCMTRDGTDQLRNKASKELERQLRIMRHEQLPSMGV